MVPETLEYQLSKEAKKAINSVSLPAIISLEDAVLFARRLYASNYFSKSYSSLFQGPIY